MRVRRNTTNNHQIGAHFVSKQKRRLAPGPPAFRRMVFYRPISAPRCMNVPPRV
jgi:hypothetical protein